MPKNIKPGDKVNGYTITALLNKGAMATAYAATSSSGRKVFFKQYKSPTVTVPWYKGYVKYQAELKRRLETTRAKEYCYEIVDFFEATWGTPCYFQVFEFVEKGVDLEENLARPHATPWDQRVLLAKVFMAGMRALHDAKIVHCDLKPDNIQLFHDNTIAAKYRLKLIDMDYSVLADVPAPWHGVQGYIGTAGYFSPEHLTGVAPTPASDIFTCGLILYELLAQGHPYRIDDATQYQSAVLGHKATPPRLAGAMPTPASNEEVAAILHRALSPKLSNRPTAHDLNLALNGRLTSSTVVTPVAAGQIELRSDALKLRFGIRTEVGRDVCKIFGEDARFLDSRQFTLERNAGNQWQIVPNLATANDTLLNGKTITAPQLLKTGDTIAVGRAAKGIAKLPLKVQLT